MAFFRILLHLNLLPSLMVEVCLVLAPDVKFFLDSRKKGSPCRHSPFFSLTQIANHSSFALGATP